MRFHELDMSNKSAMEKHIAVLCEMSKMLPENIKKDVCSFFNRSLETLKQFVDQLQTISSNMNKREDRLALVNYLDEFGANIFNKN